jgi:hypothetical protein
MRFAALASILFLTSCAAPIQLEWGSNWKSEFDSNVRIQGILFAPESGISPHLCSFHVTEDLPGCIQLFLSDEQKKSHYMLHDKCVIVTGKLDRVPLLLGNRLNPISGTMTNPSIISCMVSN